MRYALLILMLVTECLCSAEPTEKSLVQLDRENLIAEALACLTKATPDLNVNNLEFSSIDYHDFNGPGGAHALLSVTFKVLDSKLTVIQDRTTTTTYTTRQVLFRGATLPGSVGSDGKTTQHTTVNR